MIRKAKKQNNILIMQKSARETIANLSNLGFLFLIVTLIGACTNSVQYPAGQELKTNKINPDSLTPADSIKLAFDYAINGKSFQMTYLEFGSVGCRECKKMEMVMDSVREAYGDKVQVVFYHVRNNRKMMQHFGINMIPVQILLDKNGRECYRHIGYLPYISLEKEIIKYGNL